MGMDVYGKDPSNETGRYFRNNVWWWHPLWSYCEHIAPHLIPEDNGGHFNDGWGLDAVGATALAERLREELDAGRCAKFATNYQRDLEALPREHCTTCDGSGLRADVPSFRRKLLERFNSRTKQKSRCSSCDGLGTIAPWAANYPFSAENVAEFASFLEASGGFEIC